MRKSWEANTGPASRKSSPPIGCVTPRGGEPEGVSGALVAVMAGPSPPAGASRLARSPARARAVLVRAWRDERNGSSPAREPAEPEQVELRARRLAAHQPGDRTPERARELEAVPGADARDQHLRVLRMPVDDEMTIGSIRVHAGPGVLERTRGAWHQPVHGCADASNLRLSH